MNFLLLLILIILLLANVGEIVVQKFPPVISGFSKNEKIRLFLFIGLCCLFDEFDCRD